jgi:hypothetical protein
MRALLLLLPLVMSCATVRVGDVTFITIIDADADLDAQAGVVTNLDGRDAPVLPGVDLDGLWRQLAPELAPLPPPDTGDTGA